MKRSPSTVVLLAVGLWIAACGSRANITGVVQDTEGVPLAEAAATIEGSTAVGLADGTGAFKVSWIPGSYRVVVGKSGYLSHTADVDTTAVTELDLGTVTLQATPPEKGLFLFADGTFTAIGRAPIEKTARGLDRNYCAPVGVGDPTVVPAGEIAFFDWSHLDRHLIRLQDKDGKACAGISAGSPRYETVIDDDLQENVETLTDDMKMRRVNLPPGGYVYADWTNGWFKSEGSYFQVQ
ncbi:MAG: carboxypeptidase-like regulatory domain-containing protein [Myxococcota bacterium]|jgi:hypothetical protein|nr:carboxypeptidase-like regulatory domain-containing protein [Myxococcota bacterium]